MRRVALTFLAVALLAACGSSNEASGKTRITGTTERSCIKQFQKYRDRMDTARFSHVDGSIERALEELVQTVAFCPSPKVWNDVAKLIRADTTTKWGQAYEREAIRKGMCLEFEDSIYEAPACD
jgi:hypothetical protein